MKNKFFYCLLIILVLIIGVTILSLVPTSNKKEEISFSINQNKLQLKVGDNKQIDYYISDQSSIITWTSSNPSIVIVNDTGIVSAKGVGTAIVTGTINDNNEQKSIACTITVLETNYDIILEDISLPEGEILLSTNSTYILPITYIPSDGYVKNIDYITDNTNIINVENGIIKAIAPGYTSLNVIVNDSISKQIKVNVTNKEVTSSIIKSVNELILSNDNELIYINDSKKINYDIEPSDGTVFDSHWESSNPKVATVDDNGNVKGLKTGSATIELTINNYLKKSITITVKNKISEIRLDYNPKEIIKVGESFTLYPTVLPENITDQKIIYESSNSSVLSVDSGGKAIANSSGTAVITIKSEDGSITKSVSFTVLNSKGTMNTDKTIWAFSKSTDVTPKRADSDFFKALTQNGKGTLSGDTYIYQKYSYNIKTNLLTISNSNRIYMRIYYPLNKDLSTLNTFTFIGGVGEENFSGYFYSIEKNPEMIKNSGIIILIPESNNAKVRGQNVVEATEFVKAIINQNKHARNIIGGYSNGGPPSGDAGNLGHYDKYMLINTSFYWVNTRPNVKNMEYVIYSANNDSWRGTSSFINELYNFGVKDITIVTNNSSFVNAFQSKYLVINPGNSMKQGHTSENLTLSHFFSYALD